MGTDTLACMEGLGNVFVPSAAAAAAAVVANVVVANVVAANMLVGDDAAAVAGAGAGAGAGGVVVVVVAGVVVAGEIALGAPVVTQEVDGDVVDPLLPRWR